MATGERNALAHEVAELVVDVAAGMRTHHDECAARFELTPQQATLLRALGSPCAMGRVADQLGCDPSNVTRLLGRMQALGLVERLPLECDARVKQLVLSDEGRRVRAELDACLDEQLPLIADLPVASMKELRDLLARLATILGARDDAAPICSSPR